jgi:predicted Zn-dependent protease
MNASKRLVVGFVALCSVVWCVVGCVSTKTPSPVAEKASSVPLRDDPLVAQFEESRNSAEVRAARRCLDAHDADGCQQRINGVLSRAPDRLDAQLLKVETIAMRGRSKEAFALMERLMSQHAEDPGVQYVMGRLLESSGQVDGALAYYERAVKTRPANTSYSKSLREASATSPSNQAVTPASYNDTAERINVLRAAR